MWLNTVSKCKRKYSLYSVFDVLCFHVHAISPLASICVFSHLSWPTLFSTMSAWTEINLNSKAALILFPQASSVRWHWKRNWNYKTYQWLTRCVSVQNHLQGGPKLCSKIFLSFWLKRNSMCHKYDSQKNLPQTTSDEQISNIVFCKWWYYPWSLAFTVLATNLHFFYKSSQKHSIQIESISLQSKFRP